MLFLASAEAHTRALLRYCYLWGGGWGRGVDASPAPLTARARPEGGLALGSISSRGLRDRSGSVAPSCQPGPRGDGGSGRLSDGVKPSRQLLRRSCKQVGLERKTVHFCAKINRSWPAPVWGTDADPNALLASASRAFHVPELRYTVAVVSLSS